MEQIIYQFTRAELEAAYQLWFADYQEDKEAYADYDASDYDSTTYGKHSADLMIKYLEQGRAK